MNEFCDFDVKNISFGTQLEDALRKISGYRPIADLSYDNHGNQFPNLLPLVIIMQVALVLDNRGS